MDKINNIKIGVAGAIAALTALWGWFGWAVLLLAALMMADVLVGMAAACKAGNWASSRLREGAWHKGGMVVIVIVAIVADLLIRFLMSHLPGVTLPFEYTVMISPMVIVWYIIGELGSLAEHAVNMGAPMPKWLHRILDISKEAVDAAGDAITHERHEDHTGE